MQVVTGPCFSFGDLTDLSDLTWIDVSDLFDTCSGIVLVNHDMIVQTTIDVPATIDLICVFLEVEDVKTISELFANHLLKIFTDLNVV